MNILAFDTAMAACSVAVATTTAGESRLLAHFFEPRVRGHAEVLNARIGDVMEAAGIGFERLDRLAVTLGPGTFTGVRIGVAAARGMALALGLPVLGVTTLEAIAAGVVSTDAAAGRPLAVAIDARRGEVYLQCFGADGAALTEPAALDPGAAAHLAEQHGCLVVGTGAQLLAERLPGLDTAPWLAQQPDARHVAALAATRPLPEAPPEPFYLRPPDAKLPA